MSHLTILKNWYYPFYFQSWKAAAKVSSRPYALAKDSDIVSVNVSRPNVYVPQDTTTIYHKILRLPTALVGVGVVLLLYADRRLHR
jgi:hypothetical protein